MKKVFFLAILFLFQFSGFSQSWKKASYQDLLTLDFPGNYKKLDSLGRTVYYYNDSTGSYQCIISTNDPIIVTSEEELDSTFEECFKGLKNKLKPTKINSKKIILLDGLKGLRVSVQFKLKEQSCNTECFITILNQTMYLFQFVSIEDGAHKFDEFINRVNFSNANITQVESSFNAEKLGELIGALVTLTLVITIIVVIVKATEKKSA